MTAINSTCSTQPETAFLGLAPFLRMSLSGMDMRPQAQALLDQAGCDAENANLLMNLSTVMQCLGQRDIGLAIQAEALAMQRIYHLAARQQPVKLRLLMLVMPGDLATNTPLDCLLEESDIELDYYFINPDAPLTLPMPEHDVLFVAINESETNHALLVLLEQVLCDWPKPVINSPRHIAKTDRSVASLLLQNVPELLMPPTLHASRQSLTDIAEGRTRLPLVFAGCDYPVILRPIESYGGHDLDKIECAEDISAYLSNVDHADFFLAPFIDYSGEDGLFRKFRLALIDGTPYACHMGISSNWMIHYLNAGMYENADKRAEEAAFMENFDNFVETHKTALNTIYRRSGLDYFCIDCAQTKDGQLMVFEFDHIMVAHAMDPVDLFPYKQIHMKKIKKAFRDYLVRLMAGHKTSHPA